jgi:serine/threonine protein kinase
VVDCADGHVRLTGFGIASRLSRERQEPEPPETIAGTVAYMAPEQTGRMNRSIDARSDLYALGVTLSLRRAFETANQIGDLTFAAYYYTHLNTYLLAAGDPLDNVQVEVEHGLAFARNMRFGFAIDTIAGQLGLIRTLAA